MTELRKTIEAKIVQGKIYFKCPCCEYPQHFSAVYYDDFEHFGYDCPRCYARFQVKFIKDGYVIN
jgi:hypothetical protein